MDEQDQQQSGQHDTAREQFESIKQLSPYGAEYWSARELAPLLGYDSWRRFEDTIDRAKAVCAVAKQDAALHFRKSVKCVPIGSGAQREITNYYITRYGLHLLLACGDLRKPEIAQAMAYVTLTSLDPEKDYRITAETLNLFISCDIALTKEQKTIGQIVRAFKHLRTLTQYRVAPYYVDLYFPDQQIAVECDEEGHRKYTQEVEGNRQTFIERALGCTFVRYNPDVDGFNIGDVIHRIMMLVYQLSPVESVLHVN